MNLLLLHPTIVPMTSEHDRPYVASVGIAGNRIALISNDEAAIERFRADHDGCREIDCTGRILMPGLVNTHGHIAMTLQRSYADDIALMEWLHERIWPFEARQTADDIACGAELGIAEMLLGGTTSFVDMYWHEAAIARVAERTGIRALLCASCLDSNMAEFEADFEALIGNASPRVRAGVGPHAPYTVSDKNLRRCRELADRYAVPLTIHVAETHDEVSILRERTGQTPVQYLEETGIFDGPTIAAHCVHLTDGDIAVLRRRGVQVAHNPTSNMKIASGIAPVCKMLEEGVAVSIGTDGCCSNNDVDMWEEMRNASFLQKVATMDPTALPAYKVLEMATVGGAVAMGYDDLGMIREGALADLIVIDTAAPHLHPVHDAVSNLVYCGKAADVRTVIVDGRIVVEERRVVGCDLEPLYARAEATARRIAGAAHTSGAAHI